MLVNRAQLAFVKGKVQSGAQPWKGAFDKAKTDPHGSLSYTPHPRAVVGCGPSSNPNLGCTDERGDVKAAYTHVHLPDERWWITEKTGHCSTPSWYGQTTFVNGVGQETCRDFGHMEWGIFVAIQGAEAAKQQGVDLYGEQSKRLRDGLEFHAKYNLGAAVPSWLCGGSVKTANSTAWEIAYNHFSTRYGHSLPNSQRMITRLRPTGHTHFMAWETLTHAGVGRVGLP